jgi:hypothetical protein
MARYTEEEYRAWQEKARQLWSALPGHRWKDIEAITAAFLEVAMGARAKALGDAKAAVLACHLGGLSTGDALEAAAGRGS